jgi:YHS domain-containing protein
MPRSLLSVCFVAFAGAAVFASPQAKKPKVKDAPLVCPVMGAKIVAKDKAHSSHVYKGVRYYFCCGGCPASFKKDPAKYVKAFPDAVKKAKGHASAAHSAKKLIALGSCPMSGETVKHASVKTTVGEYEVPFCCESCKSHFEHLPAADKERKIAQIAEKR